MPRRYTSRWRLVGYGCAAEAEPLNVPSDEPIHSRDPNERENGRPTWSNDHRRVHRMLRVDGLLSY